MPLQLFFNELSVPSVQPARAISIGHLKQLVATVREARGIDAGLVLNSEMPLADFPLGGDTTIAAVRNDCECVEESLYLKTLNNRAPLKLAASEAREGDPDLCEYRLLSAAPVRASQIALGLGYAHLLDGLGLSLPSHDFWRERVVELELTKLDATGEVTTASVESRNADSPDAVLQLANEFGALLTPEIAHGAELWQRRAELLPNLIFIPRTQGQLEDILHGDPMLEQLWIKLSGIDKAIAAWKIAGGPHPMFPFNVRPESRSRRKLAEFKDAEGYRRVFSEHCDLAPTEGRIHFIVETNPQPHALIGHIGRKLGIG